jgi:hypothetical protein
MDATAHAQPHAISLYDLPPEVLEHIGRFIAVRPRDAAAARASSNRLFGHLDVARCAAEWGAVHTYRLIKADPPLAVIETALSLRPNPLYRRLLKAAASTGRVDVLKALVARLKVRFAHRSSPFHSMQPPRTERKRPKVPSFVRVHATRRTRSFQNFFFFENAIDGHRPR